MSTQYDAWRNEFSLRASKCAIRELYAPLFQVSPEQLHSIHTGEDPKLHYLDFKFGIDRIVRPPKLRTMRGRIRFTAQERFRSPEYIRYPDITITEWNAEAERDCRSELYKCIADFFVYGFYDSERDTILRGWVIDFQCLRRALFFETLPFIRRKNEKEQTFIVVSLRDLRWCDLILYERVAVMATSGDGR